MARDRLEVRLGPEGQERLRRIAHHRHKGMSEVVRDLIDDAYEELRRADRIAAARELGEMQALELGTPEELEAEIETMYDGLPGLR
jgi:predicted transcriptional regulator